MKVIKTFTQPAHLTETESEKTIRGGAFKAQYTVMENLNALADSAKEEGSDGIENYWEDISEMQESMQNILSLLDEFEKTQDMSKVEEIKKLIGSI